MNENVPASVTLHPDFPLLCRYLKPEYYEEDAGADGPRVRWEVRTPRGGVILRRLLAIRVLCVGGCGRAISPVRQRGGDGYKAGNIYLAVACEQDVTLSCSRKRGPKKKEYRRIEAAYFGWAKASAPERGTQQALL